MSADALQSGSFHAELLTLSITVKDLQKSLEWYTEILGFSIYRKLERDGKLRGYALKAGNVGISINQDDGAKGWDRIKGLGFSFRFTTEQSVDEIAQRFKKHNYKLDLEPTDMSWGVRAIRATDPDGFKLSISKALSR